MYSFLLPGTSFSQCTAEYWFNARKRWRVCEIWTQNQRLAETPVTGFLGAGAAGFRLLLVILIAPRGV